MLSLDYYMLDVLCVSRSPYQGPRSKTSNCNNSRLSKQEHYILQTLPGCETSIISSSSWDAESVDSPTSILPVAAISKRQKVSPLQVSKACVRIIESVNRGS